MKRDFIRACSKKKKKKGEKQGTSKSDFPYSSFWCRDYCMHTLHQFPGWQVLWRTKKKKKKKKGKERKVRMS